MVPVHAQERKEAFHEPQSRAGVHPPQYCYKGRVAPAPVGNADGTEPLARARSPGRRDACPTLGAHNPEDSLPVSQRREKNARRAGFSSAKLFARGEESPDRGLSGRSTCGVLKRTGICLRRVACQHAAPKMGAVRSVPAAPGGAKSQEGSGGL